MLTAFEPNAADGTDHDFTLWTMYASESASRVCAVDAIRAACCAACCLGALSDLRITCSRLFFSVHKLRSVVAISLPVYACDHRFRSRCREEAVPARSLRTTHSLHAHRTPYQWLPEHQRDFSGRSLSLRTSSRWFPQPEHVHRIFPQRFMAASMRRRLPASLR